MGADCSEPSARADRYLEQAFEDYDAGHFEAALRGCDKTLRYAPSLSDAHNLRGVVLEELGRSEEAADAYGIALELDSGFHEARQNLRELAVEWGERLLEDARTLGDRVGQHPDDRTVGPDPDIEMAELHLAQAYKANDAGQYEAALRGSYLALALDPFLADAHNLRGLALEELDRPGAAAEAYRQALVLEPNFTDARDNWLGLEAELAERRCLVTVATFLHPLEAHIARGRLEGAGIPSIINLNYLWFVGFHGVRLLVTKENATDALEVLLREPDQGEYELGENDGQPL